eukprot:5536072-Pleurochrysis_carterae.AAC.1
MAEAAAELLAAERTGAAAHWSRMLLTAWCLLRLACIVNPVKSRSLARSPHLVPSCPPRAGATCWARCFHVLLHTAEVHLAQPGARRERLILLDLAFRAMATVLCRKLMHEHEIAPALRTLLTSAVFQIHLDESLQLGAEEQSSADGSGEPRASSRVPTRVLSGAVGLAVASAAAAIDADEADADAALGCEVIVRWAVRALHARVVRPAFSALSPRACAESFALAAHANDGEGVWHDSGFGLSHQFSGSVAHALCCIVLYSRTTGQTPQLACAPNRR